MSLDACSHASSYSSQYYGHHPLYFRLKSTETKQLHRQTCINDEQWTSDLSISYILWSDVSDGSLQRTELIKTRPAFQNLIGYRKHARGMGLPNQHLKEVMGYVRLTGSSHWYPRRLDGTRRRQTATKIHFPRTSSRDGQIFWLVAHISSQVNFMAHTFLSM